jgi:hypothetical protein
LATGSASNPGNQSITATTQYKLGSNQDLYVNAYFPSAAAALTDGAGHNIPSSDFYISDNGGAYQALTHTLIESGIQYGGSNAGLVVRTVAINNLNQRGTVIDTMVFNINLSSLASLPPGTYIGTLYIQDASTQGGKFSSPQPILITATFTESLTVSLSASSVSFALMAGSANNAGSTSIMATTQWALKSSRTAVAVYAYFANSASALSDGAGDNIPSSAFYISDNGGASTALTNTVAFGGASAGLQLANVAITNANRNSSRTDAMTFNINLSGGILPQLPPGTYTGTLNIQAQATP